MIREEGICVQESGEAWHVLAVQTGKETQALADMSGKLGWQQSMTGHDSPQ